MAAASDKKIVNDMPLVFLIWTTSFRLQSQKRLNPLKLEEMMLLQQPSHPSSQSLVMPTRRNSTLEMVDSIVQLKCEVQNVSFVENRIIKIIKNKVRGECRGGEFLLCCQ